MAFRCHFLDPINQEDPKGWERLRALFRAISLRRTKAVLESEIALLPPEQITCQISLDEEERRAYGLMKQLFAMAIDSGGGHMNAFQLILRLRQICNHGVGLLPASSVEWLKLAAQFGPQAPLQAEACESCGAAPQEIDGAVLDGLSCAHQICRACRLEETQEELDGVMALSCPLCRVTTARRGLSGQQSLLPNGSPYRPSSKVRALLRNLDQDQEMAKAAGLPPEKRSVFSFNASANCTYFPADLHSVLSSPHGPACLI